MDARTENFYACWNKLPWKCKGEWNVAPRILSLGTVRWSGQIHIVAASFQITEAMAFFWEGAWLESRADLEAVAAAAFGNKAPVRSQPFKEAVNLLSPFQWQH
jgi:hypothetical protein